MANGIQQMEARAAAAMRGEKIPLVEHDGQPVVKRRQIFWDDVPPWAELFVAARREGLRVEIQLDSLPKT